MRATHCWLSHDLPPEKPVTWSGQESAEFPHCVAKQGLMRPLGQGG